MLSAEIRPTEQVASDLAVAFGFSQKALEQNRKGRMTSAQRLPLFKTFLKPVLATVLFLAFAAWLAIGRGAPEEPTLKSRLFHYLPAVLVGGVGLALATRIPFASYFDALGGSLVIREGRIESREEDVYVKGKRKDTTNYYFHLKTETFRVTRQAFNAIESGAAYRLYLAPRSRTIVAIEPRV